jgi:NADH-quinone oxidoreductase subunit L
MTPPIDLHTPFTYLELIARAALLIAVSAPLMSLVLLGISTLINRPLPERRSYDLICYTSALSLTAVLSAWGVMWAAGRARLDLALGTLLSTSGYALELKLRVDTAALTLLTLNFALCVLVGVMAGRYLHREEGANRFAFMINLLAVSVALIASASGLDILFVGWELLGLSSTLLISFFMRRPSPVEHGLRAFAIYRVTDVGLLAGVVTAHHTYHTVNFDAIAAQAPLAPLALSLMLIWGAMGKGAMVPFTGWLPRAMEGPTPSSAVFYGALSIHASPFLLMRVAPILNERPVALWIIGVIGGLTALHARMSGRVQGDVKSFLAYASISQVGLMWVEVALGWHTLIYVHMIGHATLRTWQIIRSPSTLQERQQLIRYSGQDIGLRPRHGEARLTDRWESAIYRVSLERWHLDDGLKSIWLRVERLLLVVDRADRAVARALSGKERSL